MFRSTTTRTTLAIAIAVLLAAPAVRADRLSDKDVKALIERIDNERDRFEDQLDGTLKRAILSSPRGEVNVEQFLDDLQENVDRLKERFTAEVVGQRRSVDTASPGVRDLSIHVDATGRSRRRERMESPFREPAPAGGGLRHDPACS